MVRSVRFRAGFFRVVGIQILSLLSILGPGVFGEESMYLDRMDTRSAISYYQDGVHTFSVRDEDWKWKERIWRPRSLRYSMVYRPLILSLPGRKVVVGKSWNVVHAIRNLGQCEPFDVAGRCTLVGIEVRDAERMGVIEGKLRFRRAISPSEKSKSTPYRVRGFDIAYKALFSGR